MFRAFSSMPKMLPLPGYMMCNIAVKDICRTRFQKFDNVL